MSALSQILELRLESKQLEEENRTLSEENVQSIAEMENLRQQLADLIKENKERETFPAEDKTKVYMVDVI